MFNESEPEPSRPRTKTETESDILASGGPIYEISYDSLMIILR